jgi:hypothetical protein
MQTTAGWRRGNPVLMVKQSVSWLILVGIVLLSGIAILEALLRLFAPQPYIYPRYQYSERYGQTLYPSTAMVAERPGHWRFTYTTNEFGLRGPTVAVSNRYDLRNIAVLGDSYSFGNGVNDGEPFPAILADLLVGRANVVNLGVPGYGLSQQIRLYYEFGQVYQPLIVLLQFTNNDPADNLFYRVSKIENGRFVFQRDRSINPILRTIKDFLSNSIIQRSQAYNFVRDHVYEALRARKVARGSNASIKQSMISHEEQLHNDLLELFVEDLSERGIEVVLFGVNGHLTEFPAILAKVKELDRRRLLTYVASEPWFEGVSDYASPEGHAWGAKAHRIVARELAPMLAAKLSDARQSRSGSQCHQVDGSAPKARVIRSGEYD